MDTLSPARSLRVLIGSAAACGLYGSGDSGWSAAALSGLGSMCPPTQSPVATTICSPKGPVETLDAMAEKQKHRIEIDWVTNTAGALAAMSSAVLLSTLGAAGTILGAALGSAVISVGSSLYGQGLASSRERMATLQHTAREPVGVANAEGLRARRNIDHPGVAVAHLDYTEDRHDRAPGEQDRKLTEDLEYGRYRPDLQAHLPWRRAAVTAAGLFAVAVVAITAFELIAGQSVSSFTGGSDSGDRSSIGGLAGGSGNRHHDQPPQQPSKDPASTEPPRRQASRAPHRARSRAPRRASNRRSRPRRRPRPRWPPPVGDAKPRADFLALGGAEPHALSGKLWSNVTGSQ